MRKNFEKGDRVKTTGWLAFTSRPWEPGTIIKLIYLSHPEPMPDTVMAEIAFDNPYLGIQVWGRLDELEFEHTEDELIERVLGDYFA